MSKAVDYIDSVAQESGNRRAFYHGLAFGLGQASEILNKFKDITEAQAWIEIILTEVDDMYFKKEQN